MGEFCKGAGARLLMDTMRRQQGPLDVDETPCLGACDCAPVVSYDGNLIERASASRLTLQIERIAS